MAQYGPCRHNMRPSLKFALPCSYSWRG